MPDEYRPHHCTREERLGWKRSQQETGKDAGGANPETGAVPFPQQKVKGRTIPLNVGGTTKHCNQQCSRPMLMG